LPLQILFNLGLTYGFTALGNQAGVLLPSAYIEVENEPRSPFYDYIGGIFLVGRIASTIFERFPPMPVHFV